jgi:hypothetical protein
MFSLLYWIQCISPIFSWSSFSTGGWEVMYNVTALSTGERHRFWSRFPLSPICINLFPLLVYHIPWEYELQCCRSDLPTKEILCKKTSWTAYRILKGTEYIHYFAEFKSLSSDSFPSNGKLNRTKQGLMWTDSTHAVIGGRKNPLATVTWSVPCFTFSKLLQ